METRANFILIGAFTLFGILGSLGFFLWLAKVEVDRQYAYYDVLFTDVSGLGEAGDVRYNGLPVGQVARLSLDRDDPGKVRVRIEIDAATPVKTDTIATLELQGVTGVSYVSLSGGTPEAARLQAAPGEKFPVITSRRSAVQSLFEGGPELLT
jgi:phospholipid/cholesterol/gamma-HCH transport system substrate-binding protein